MSTKRCPHTHIHYRETTEFDRTHVFENGKRKESIGHEAGNLQSNITIDCDDCDLSKEYDLSSKACPKWVRALNQALLDGDDMEGAE